MHFGSLLEELTVLTYDTTSEEFTIKKHSFFNIALSGGVLLELILEGRLANVKEKLVVVDASPVQDEIVNHCFSFIKSESEPKSSIYWIRELVVKSKIYTRKFLIN